MFISLVLQQCKLTNSLPAELKDVSDLLLTVPVSQAILVQELWFILWFINVYSAIRTESSLIKKEEKLVSCSTESVQV